MATASEPTIRPGFAVGVGAVAGPLFALIAAWLTSAGHTANFREMNLSRGWISSVGYGLHSGYLFSVALSILLAPALMRRASSHFLAQLGLVLLCAGSFLNGFDLHAPYVLAVFGRLMAGFGVGLVLCNAPRLLPTPKPAAVDWFGIVLPPFGPLIIAGASITYGWSSWEGGFLFEGIVALFALALVVPFRPPPEPSIPAHGSLVYWPATVVGFGCLWYWLQWGHLSGWTGDRTVLLVGFIGVAAFVAALWLAWPGQDPLVLRQATSRWVLCGYAGAVQFFQVSETGVFGGLFINVSDWDRAVQIWPLGIGAGVALAIGQTVWWTGSPGRAGSVAGLLAITAGMGWAYTKMLGWPFWDVLNVVEFNWFDAPQTWEMAPGRFLIGFGHGFLLLSENRRFHPDPAREARIKPGLQVAQFVGGGIGIGLLSTVLLAGHQWQYSYTADRGVIQASEVAERTGTLREVFAASGAASESGRRAEVLMFRSVNYQADALMFADVYAAFGVSSLVLASVLIVWMGWDAAGLSRKR